MIYVLNDFSENIFRVKDIFYVTTADTSLIIARPLVSIFDPISVRSNYTWLQRTAIVCALTTAFFQKIQN